MPETTKHTPGPWVARMLHETQRTYCTILAPGKDIATIGSSRGQAAEEIEANARLMAAAPDLLAAAEYALDLCESISGIPAVEEGAAILRKLIAKATGR